MDRLHWRNIPLLRGLIYWSKKTSFIGLQKVPIFDVVSFVYKETTNDNIVTRANSMAFSFFLALFPFIIFLFTLLPLIPTISDYAINVRQSIHGILPAASEDYLFTIVDDIVSRQRSGLLSFGLVLAIFFASNGMVSMIDGFDKSRYTEAFRTRSWFRKRLLAIVLTLLISGVFVSSTVLIVLGNWVVNYLVQYFELTGLASVSFNIVRWIVVSMLIYTTIGIIYRYGPATIQRTPFFSVGATLATFLTIVVSLGFSYFVANFGQYNELYGSIGALIVTLLWFNFICFILLVGFELNASITVNRVKYKKRKKGKRIEAI